LKKGENISTKNRLTGSPGHHGVRSFSIAKLHVDGRRTSTLRKKKRKRKRVKRGVDQKREKK